MDRYRICVYAIAKNEEKFVDRWMDAVSEADVVVVSDTGSTDQTVEKLRARGAQVFVDRIDPWRFDAARNKAMDHIPDDVDICVCSDIDEILMPGWREKLEAAWQPQHTRARYRFTWLEGGDGKPIKQFFNEKIHRRNGFRWIHPVHEILVYTGEEAESVAWIDGLVVIHRPDPQKPRSQYLPLLELSALENPNDGRVAFWLGREYLFYRQYDACIQTLKRYLAMPGAQWDEEKSAAMRFIADCYQNQENMQAAKSWLFRAIAECPRVREPYLHMAKFAYATGDWPLIFYMVEQGLAIIQKSGSYLMEPEAWGAALYDLGAIACYRLGLYEKARDYVNDAVALQPEDERLGNNRKLIELKLKENKNHGERSNEQI